MPTKTNKRDKVEMWDQRPSRRVRKSWQPEEVERKEKRNHLRKESTEKPASKPGESSWRKEGEMLPSLEGRLSSMLFLQHNLQNLFIISLCILGLKETSFPRNAFLSSTPRDRLSSSTKPVALNSSQKSYSSREDGTKRQHVWVIRGSFTL